MMPTIERRPYIFDGKNAISVRMIPAIERKPYIFDGKNAISVRMMPTIERKPYIFYEKNAISVSLALKLNSNKQKWSLLAWEWLVENSAQKLQAELGTKCELGKN